MKTVMTRRRETGPVAALVRVALVVVLGLAGTSVRAQEHQEAHDSPAHESTQEEGHEGHGQTGTHGEAAEEFAGHHVHAEHKNGVALFLGGTMESAENQTFGTIGLEYEHKLADRWAFQLIAEHVNDFDAWVVTAPVGFRLAGTLWAVAGPGLETEARRTGLEPEPHEDVHGTSHDDGHSSESHEEGGGPFFLWRFGFVYGIHLGESGRFALTPSLSLDLVREHGEWLEGLVFGVGLTYHF